MWISYTDGYVNSDKLVTIFVVKKDNGKWAVVGGFEGDEFVTFDTYDNKVLAERQAGRIARTLNGQPLDDIPKEFSKPEEPKKSKYDTDNHRVKCIKITDDDDIEKMAKMICDQCGEEVDDLYRNEDGDFCEDCMRNLFIHIDIDNAGDYCVESEG